MTPSSVLGRSGAFFRRRGGLMKKAYELAKLCDVHVGLIITDRKGHVHTFKTHEKIDLGASELDESHKRSRTNRKHFEYSDKDYPFNKVYNMTREVKEFGIPGYIDTNNPKKSHLSKRGRSEDQHLGDQFSPNKHLKIEKGKQIGRANETTKFPDNNEPEMMTKDSSKTKKKLPASMEQFLHFHSIDLRVVITKLSTQTHPMQKAFDEQFGDYLSHLKLYNHHSNHYFSGNFDIHFEQVWLWRVLVANYFSHKGSLLATSIRKIPLKEFCKFLELWKLYSKPDKTEFIKSLLLHIEVILLVLMNKIKTKKHNFSFLKEIQKLSKPVKYLAFKKWVRKLCGYLKTIYAITKKEGSENISDQSTNDQAPKKITFKPDPDASEESIQVLKDYLKSHQVDGMDYSDDFIMTLALNEICYFGLFSVVEKQFLESLGSEEMERIIKYAKKYSKIEVKDVERSNNSSSWDSEQHGEDFLVDLRSRRSVNSVMASHAQFSFEG